ncbi:MAG: hypothetical protein AB7P76_08840 [Candidatus Melainabacteria bacterium]
MSSNISLAMVNTFPQLAQAPPAPVAQAARIIQSAPAVPAQDTRQAMSTWEQSIAESEARNQEMRKTLMQSGAIFA